MADRFHTPHEIGLGEFALDGPEAHHLATVRRGAVGETIMLFNGDGAEYEAEIIAVGKRTVTLHVRQRREANREREHKITIAAAMPKGDRGDFMIEKLTEVGVARFVPLITERSVVVPKSSRLESLRRSVIEASKQCGRNVLMEIAEAVKWSEFAKRDDLPARRVLFHPDGEPFAAVDGDAVFAIGPEGGFTEEEVNERGWSRASLGPRILRVETAAIAVATSPSISPKPL
jgi:16S rRNA (uracil1498-N3)-methyltransferase